MAAMSTSVLATFVVLIALAITYRFFNRSKTVFIPVWVVLEVALTSFLLPKNGRGRRILSLLRRRDGSLFGFSSQHTIFTDPSHVDRMMAHSAGSISAMPTQYTITTRVFGSTHSPALEKKFYAAVDELVAPVSRLFLNDAAATAALERSNIPEAVNSLVSFSPEPDRMELWEKSANINMTTTTDGVQAVEADLLHLIRDFGACIAIPQLYGKDFLARYPDVLSDLWKFDNDLFPLLMIGMPSWMPLKMVKDGIEARSRIHAGLEGLYRRVAQHVQGQPIDFDADMSDVSNIPMVRHHIYDKNGFTFAERGAMEMGLLWGQNANTQPMLFWLLTYLYSTPGLLVQVREEMAPYLHFSDTVPRELTGLDVARLGTECQLLKACVFETYRFVNQVTSIRHVFRPMTVTEGDGTHQLPSGSYLSASLSLSNHDASVYSDPDRFDPTRFLEQSASTGKPVARYGKLKPWGSGSAMCKGRTFAEKEIMSLGAAIIAVWDIAPVGGGQWELPARVPGTGVQKPVKDIRVEITRRKE